MVETASSNILINLMEYFRNFDSTPTHDDKAILSCTFLVRKLLDTCQPFLGTTNNTSVRLFSIDSLKRFWFPFHRLPIGGPVPTNFALNYTTLPLGCVEFKHLIQRNSQLSPYKSMTQLLSWRPLSVYTLFNMATFDLHAYMPQYNACFLPLLLEKGKMPIFRRLPGPGPDFIPHHDSNGSNALFHCTKGFVRIVTRPKGQSPQEETPVKTDTETEKAQKKLAEEEEKRRLAEANAQTPSQDSENLQQNSTQNNKSSPAKKTSS